MPTITAAIITFNEERNIQRCIDSLINCVDQILVLDSFSTDNTVNLCIENNVQVIQHKWLGYSKAKNYLNTHIKTELIFSIDADEELTEQLQNEISQIRKIGPIAFYSINRITNYCGAWIRHSGWFPDVKVRISPRELTMWDGEIVHEELLLPKDTKCINLNGLLAHYSYYSQKEHQTRADQYSRLTAIKYMERGQNASFLKPYISGAMRFLKMYFWQKGFLDGKSGWAIAKISAKSNIYKYKELRRLISENE
jgi:glycosyltransferase involved in cell wall biosynthesis